MQEVITVKLSRDVKAVQIPAGNTVPLVADTEVSITQTLGGSFTPGRTRMLWDRNSRPKPRKVRWMVK